MRSLVLTAAACAMFVSDLNAAPIHGPGALAAAHPDSAPVNFTFLDFPGSSFTGLYATNLGATPHAKLQAVGGYMAGNSGTGSGFLVKLTTKNATISEVYEAVLPAISNLAASGINDAGHIVGTFTSDTTHGFLLVNGTMTQIDVPFQGAGFTQANGINDAGLIVGAWGPASGDESYGFTLHHGAYTQLPSYPGETQNYPFGVNNKGDIAGNLTDSNGVTHGYLLQNGVYTLLDPPGSVYTVAGGVNDSDAVVGLYCTTLAACGTPATGIHGFLYSNGTYTTIDYPGAPRSQVSGINDQGTMAGFYIDQSGAQHGFLINP